MLVLVEVELLVLLDDEEAEDVVDDEDVEEVEDVVEDELVELLDSGGSEVSSLPLDDSTGSGLLSELIGVLCGVDEL